MIEPLIIIKSSPACTLRNAMQAHAGHAWSNGSTRRECHSATSCPATCDVVDKRTHDIISHTQPSNGRRLDHQVLCDSLTTLHCTTNNALARPLNDNARASTPHGAGTSSSTNSHTVHTPEHSRPPTQAEEEALGNPPPIPEKTRERRKVLSKSLKWMY